MKKTYLEKKPIEVFELKQTWTSSVRATQCPKQGQHEILVPGSEASDCQMVSSKYRERESIINSYM